MIGMSCERCPSPSAVGSRFCKPCRLRISSGGQGRRNTIVAGPPCSGKTTYVAERRGPNDLVIDLDALRVALGSPVLHNGDADPWLPFAFAARDAVLSRLADAHDDIDHVWIIACAPRREQRELIFGADVIVLGTTAEVCHQRAAAERPLTWHRLIDEWFRDYEPDPVAYWHLREREPNSV